MDLNKCEFDVIATELGMVNLEIKHMLKNLNKLTRRKRVRNNLLNFPAKSYVYQEPYGVALIMSPWNYPLQLSLVPLIGAVAAGNTVVLKPSDYSHNVAKAIKKVLSVFDDKYISVVLGGREQNAELLDNKFDFIFFTGGETVGRLVMEKASKYLTPVLLELGGKSPCIVDKDADINLAAKRIVWGKFLNCGQTCVAPDYVYAHKDIKPALIEKFKFYIQKFYYKNGVLNEDFANIINDKHAERLKGLIDKDKVVFGGKQTGRRIEPVILDNVTFSDAVMCEEIFGPILPVLEFEDIETVVSKLNGLEKPLAFYYFSENKKNAEKIINSLSFGGGCVNDCIMHLTNSKLPFGGIGKSGMGSYHGKKSFEAFSHAKSIFVKGKLELNVKYPPYTKGKLRIVKLITRTKKQKTKD
ncbi:aldehyde dehydrogenase [Holotrichia oblita]|nr:aldehyde dehydrogenase [Holotrichia oblita]